jgi:hypothetical protein
MVWPLRLWARRRMVMVIVENEHKNEPSQQEASDDPPTVIRHRLLPGDMLLGVAAWLVLRQFG